MPTDADFERLEKKVDGLVAAIETLIRVEERQVAHAERILSAETRLAAMEASMTLIDRKLERWINRGVGVWAVVMIVWTVYLAWRPTP